MQIGIGVNLDKGVAQYALVKELGVQHLIIRMPLWEMEKIDEYVAFAKGFGDKKFVINILQNREYIEDLALLKQDIEIIFDKFQKQKQCSNIQNQSH
jgi:hypothetical protein